MNRATVSTDTKHAWFRPFIGLCAVIYDTIEDDGWTPLMLTCMMGHNELIPFLVEAGAKVNLAKVHTSSTS